MPFKSKNQAARGVKISFKQIIEHVNKFCPNLTIVCAGPLSCLSVQITLDDLCKEKYGRVPVMRLPYYRAGTLPRLL